MAGIDPLRMLVAALLSFWSMAADFQTDVSDEELVALVQAYARSFVPEAVCELKDYGFRVGLGALDRNDELQEVVFLRRGGLTPDRVEFYAKALLNKLYPD
jgi:hypothetical protein